MNKVKILVVEDEIIIADHICDSLDELGYEPLEPAINYTEAIETIEAEKPDIAILDVQLAGKKTGIDLAKTIKDKYDFPFIFLTSNADAATVNLAKEVMPPAYLIKPFTKEDLFSSIEIALHNFSKKTGEAADNNLFFKDSLFIKEKGFYTKVLFDDILYIESSHVYVEIFLKNQQKLLVRSSLTEILSDLSSSFIRVHRGFIVNIKHLIQLNNNVVVIGEKSIPIGKKYREDILKVINSI
ncbi:LytR/AlgR family response regulator transcription factor [Polaribacter uvawellassae]|uniref:LytR/AlgR family response regulator transcription factor n=1 Tax=Polaribacter uvawellassae TaxID=3133495 RepID=UPI00321B70B3